MTIDLPFLGSSVVIYRYNEIRTHMLTVVFHHADLVHDPILINCNYCSFRFVENLYIQSCIRRCKVSKITKLINDSRMDSLYIAIYERCI